tara:strand:- start:1914 stop:2273 length:360 start_codon:yes stop_codon:yes gene_type:complete
MQSDIIVGYNKTANNKEVQQKMSNLKNLTGKEVNEGVEDSTGDIHMTGAGIDFYRLLMIKQALSAQCCGFRLTNKAPQGTTLARRHLGLKGNKESLLKQVEQIIARIQAERAEDYNGIL